MHRREERSVKGRSAKRRSVKMVGRAYCPPDLIRAAEVGEMRVLLNTLEEGERAGSKLFRGAVMKLSQSVSTPVSAELAQEAIEVLDELLRLASSASAVAGGGKSGEIGRRLISLAGRMRSLWRRLSQSASPCLCYKVSAGSTTEKQEKRGRAGGKAGQKQTLERSYVIGPYGLTGRDCLALAQEVSVYAPSFAQLLYVARFLDETTALVSRHPFPIIANGHGKLADGIILHLDRILRSLYAQSTEAAEAFVEVAVAMWGGWMVGRIADYVAGLGKDGDTSASSIQESIQKGLWRGIKLLFPLPITQGKGRATDCAFLVNFLQAREIGRWIETRSAFHVLVNTVPGKEVIALLVPWIRIRLRYADDGDFALLQSYAALPLPWRYSQMARIVSAWGLMLRGLTFPSFTQALATDDVSALCSLSMLSGNTNGRGNTNENEALIPSALQLRRPKFFDAKLLETMTLMADDLRDVARMVVYDLALIGGYSVSNTLPNATGTTSREAVAGTTAVTGTGTKNALSPDFILRQLLSLPSAEEMAQVLIGLCTDVERFGGANKARGAEDEIAPEGTETTAGMNARIIQTATEMTVESAGVDEVITEKVTEVLVALLAYRVALMYLLGQMKADDANRAGAIWTTEWTQRAQRLSRQVSQQVIPTGEMMVSSGSKTRSTKGQRSSRLTALLSSPLSSPLAGPLAIPSAAQAEGQGVDLEVLDLYRRSPRPLSALSTTTTTSGSGVGAGAEAGAGNIVDLTALLTDPVWGALILGTDGGLETFLITLAPFISYKTFISLLSLGSSPLHPPLLGMDKRQSTIGMAASYAMGLRAGMEAWHLCATNASSAAHARVADYARVINEAILAFLHLPLGDRVHYRFRVGYADGWEFARKSVAVQKDDAVAPNEEEGLGMFPFSQSAHDLIPALKLL